MCATAFSGLGATELSPVHFIYQYTCSDCLSTATNFCLINQWFLLFWLFQVFWINLSFLQFSSTQHLPFNLASAFWPLLLISYIWGQTRTYSLSGLLHTPCIGGVYSYYNIVVHLRWYIFSFRFFLGSPSRRGMICIDFQIWSLLIWNLVVLFQCIPANKRYLRSQNCPLSLVIVDYFTSYSPEFLFFLTFVA